jgi:hypothetical protein
MVKTSEDILEKKRQYYQENKEKILARKHERKDIIYQNKIKRKLMNPEEWHKEQMRKLSKIDNIRPDACELCGKKQSELDHLLECHHESYEDTKGVWVDKNCHSILDRSRRRREDKLKELQKNEKK